MWLESLKDRVQPKQDWSEEDEKIKKAIIGYIDHGQHYGVSNKDMIAWLEKQGEDKKEINNFEVLPGLYKCIHRMFDGKLLFEVGNVYKCLSKRDRAEFEVSYGHSVYLEDPVVCKHFIPFKKLGANSVTLTKGNTSITNGQINKDSIHYTL